MRRRNRFTACRWPHRTHQNPGSSGTALPPLNLLMGLDLPWAADGALRDGPATQQAIDNRLRQQLDRWQCPYQTIYGSGTARVAAALQAISYHLTPHLHVDSRINAWQIAIKSEAEYSINESVSSQKMSNTHLLATVATTPPRSGRRFRVCWPAGARHRPQWGPDSTGGAATAVVNKWAASTGSNRYWAPQNSHPTST
jgi:hypothetical protein